MNELFASQKNAVGQKRSIAGEEALLKELRALWQPYQQCGLEIRYQMGILLNQQLGRPDLRQSYGQGTIERVANELDLDKSEISRMRRFASRFQTFEEFQKQHPSITSWTKVRELVSRSRSPHHPPDSRALWGLQRSVNASIAVLSRDVPFCGPQVDQLRTALQELFSLAQARFGFQLDAVRDGHRQED